MKKSESITVGSSVDALLFFEKKFSDLFGLIPQLERVKSLQNHIVELEKAAAFYEEETKKSAVAKEASEKDVSDLKKKHLELAAKASSMVSEADNKVKAILSSVGEETKKLQEAIIEEQKENLSRVTKKLSESAQRLSDVEASIKTKEAELKNISDAVLAARSKLGIV
jgi:chromosome segregation ATPase